MFGALETEARRMTDGANQTALVLGKITLGIVLDDGEIVPIGKGEDGSEVRRQPEDADGNDRPGVFGDSSLNVRRINAECVRVAVHKYRHRTALNNHKASRGHSQCRHNHLIARTDACRQ